MVFPLKNGETLLEAIIAVSVLLITLTFVGDTFSGAQRGLRFSRNEARAAFLAREGEEAVKNILLTNKLHFPSDIDHCWNAGWTSVVGPEGGLSRNPVSNISQCPANPIGPAGSPLPTVQAGLRDSPGVINSNMLFFRVLFFPETGRFQLDSRPGQLFDYDADGKLVLNLMDSGCDSAPPCFARGSQARTSAEAYGVSLDTNGYYRYIQNPDRQPIFYRAIGITYFDSLPGDDGDEEPLADTMKAVSVVAFQESGGYKLVAESF